MTTSRDVFELAVEKIRVRRANEVAVINAAIATTKADFAQFDGITLISPYTTLKVNTAAYNGTTNNAITISLDNGSTVFTTVTAHADEIPHCPPRLYYRAVHVLLDGTMDGLSDDTNYVTAPDAVQMMMRLGIQGIVA